MEKTQVAEVRACIRRNVHSLADMDQLNKLYTEAFKRVEAKTIAAVLSRYGVGSTVTVKFKSGARECVILELHRTRATVRVKGPSASAQTEKKWKVHLTYIQL